LNKFGGELMALVINLLPWDYGNGALRRVALGRTMKSLGWTFDGP